MKKSLAILLFATAIHCSLAAQNDPKANPASVVECGKARFTVLTDRMVRMEWAADSQFEDRATLAIVNRNLPAVKFTTQKKGDVLTIKTSALTLTYKGGEKFNEQNLAVSFRLSGKTVTWHPGASDEGNLRGTMRTLDRIAGRSSKTALTYNDRKGGRTPSELENGILSKDGWAIIDESGRHILEKDNSDWGEWVKTRPEGDRQDLYILAYGHDYIAALGDYTKVAGNIPLPPKYTLGYWWSRYWIYTDQELLEIASEMRERKVPIDVFIVDMDWHQTWKPLKERVGGRDEFGQRPGWTGYTWNSDLFPDPKGFLYDLHKMNYVTALNLHPASGIQPYEEPYRRFVEDYTTRTDDYDGPKDFVYDDQPYVFAGNKQSFAKEGHSAPVPFRLDQQAWADSYFKTVIRPMEEMGVDFWWLDWQQWMESKYVKGLSNTFWCNYAFWNDKVRQTRELGTSAPRPLIYHRWGGLGSHRYQLGFSGDTYDEWEVLGALPYFTATASNVGYGYWGHDIGGHMQLNGHLTDPEMYTRWLQYGVFTPIFKTHSTQSEYLERKIWAYPTHYEYMKAAIQLRYALSPYIYDAARQAFDTGVSMTRPLYYYYPEEQKAYDCDQEFFFGDNILATVLCQPIDPKTGKTERQMWFPKGNDWYDMAQHKMRKGGTTQTLYYSIDENPWFVREGAVIPLAEEGIQDLQHISSVLRLLVVPGKSKCDIRHYEDDGVSQAYEKDFAVTNIHKTVSGGRTTIVVEPRQGTFNGAPETRQIIIVAEGISAKQMKVSVTGASGAEVRYENGCATITLPATPVNEKITITY